MLSEMGTSLTVMVTEKLFLSITFSRVDVCSTALSIFSLYAICNYKSNCNVSTKKEFCELKVNIIFLLFDSSLFVKKKSNFTILHFDQNTYMMYIIYVKYISEAVLIQF